MYTSIHAYLYAYIHLLYLVIKTFIQSSVATSEGCLKFKGNSRTMVIRHLLKVIQLFFSSSGKQKDNHHIQSFGLPILTPNPRWSVSILLFVAGTPKSLFYALNTIPFSWFRS